MMPHDFLEDIVTEINDPQRTIPTKNQRAPTPLKHFKHFVKSRLHKDKPMNRHAHVR